jgi:hypothetical protein
MSKFIQNFNYKGVFSRGKLIESKNQFVFAETTGKAGYFNPADILNLNKTNIFE